MKAGTLFVAPLVLLLVSTGWAHSSVLQPVQERQVQVDRSGSVPIYKVTVVARTTKAINYRHRSHSTKVDFRGTVLMPQAKGIATVDSKQGRIEINVKMEKLTPATQFGPEYLTYVLWAITPEGRPKNLGEVLLNGEDSKLDVTTDLQAFGLIVTAEPYFAVTQPSDVVVMENFVREDTVGTIEAIDAKFELLQRGQYTLNVNPAELRAMPLDRKIPLELYEARNAVRIAHWIGAERYAGDTFKKAEISLQSAEDELAGKVGKKTVAQNSREAAQTAEDARLIAIRRIEDEQRASELAAEQQREADARARASQSEADRASAERAKADAERAKAEADLAAERARKEKSDAEEARGKALAEQQKAQADAEKAQAEAEKARQAAAQA
jgi:hypothetical protein